MTTATSSENDPFTGSFLWINHDATNRGARPHRKRVFGHIQTHYRTFERESRNRALRASVKIPVTGSGVLTTVIPRGKHVARHGKRTNSTHLSTASPPLLKGNSDPFSVFAVEITPQVNELLTFYRDLFIPSVYRTGPQGWKTSKAANAEWRRRMEGLRDEGGALTFLARHARIASIATTNSKLSLEALSFTAKSTSVLRARLEGNTAVNSAVYWHISLLWGIEILQRNFSNAIIHGKMLRSLLEKQSLKGQVDLAMVRAILYNAAHLDCMTMQPSVFDYENWIPKTFRPLRELAEKDMPALKDPPHEMLDASIEGEFLRGVFADRRRHTRIWYQYPDLSVGISPAVDAWLAVKSHIHVALLVKHAVTSIDETDLFPSRSASLYAQGYLSLALLYTSRQVRAGFMVVCGVEIHDSQRTILSQLRNVLYRAEVFENDIERERYRNAKLFALFTGAQAERNLHPDRRMSDHGWFNRELVALSKQMGLSQWAPAESILGGFLYVDKIQPHGSQWWGTALN